jgi:hypothetical protein
MSGVYKNTDGEGEGRNKLKISEQTYIRKISSSSLSRAIGYSDCGFCNFTQSHQANDE